MNPKYQIIYQTDKVDEMIKHHIRGRKYGSNIEWAADDAIVNVLQRIREIHGLKPLEIK